MTESNSTLPKSESSSERDTIVVLDFGAQYSHLIARRIRELNVYCILVPYDAAPETLAIPGLRGIILSGGPSSVLEPDAPRPDPAIFQMGLPVLGICYGLQLLGHLLGGRVSSSQKREFGRAVLSHSNSAVVANATLAKSASPGLFEGLAPELTVWMSHGDRVEELPPGFKVLGQTENSPIAAIGDPEKHLYGVQFHPEVNHTPQGREILRNFVVNICGCSPTWTPQSFIDEATEKIRRQVGEERVLTALSGGVDSSVLALLIRRAVGDRLTCVFVDNGLLRKNEAEEVVRVFKESFGITFKHVDAVDRFLDKLEGVTDPEEKRRIIGHEFIEVFTDAARELGEFQFLAQGTIYPDVIESISAKGGPSATIKSHHNVGGLPEEMHLELVEPLRDLFKDEVRAVGRELGLQEEIIRRHPFPGPGLAVRVVGEISREKLHVLREADAIALEEIRAAGLYDEIAQGFTVLLPVQTVGVMGDARTYENVIALRAVTTEDFMTADWYRFPPDVLARISNRIINEVAGVNRVVYDISSKPPSTIEWE